MLNLCALSVPNDAWMEFRSDFEALLAQHEVELLTEQSSGDNVELTEAIYAWHRAALKDRYGQDV
jgi:hypothetical protein